MNNKKLKIAILGTRGVPANYSGFETFAEELGIRLAKKDHDIIVYCRRGTIDWDKDTYKGIKLVFLSTIKHKYFDTIAHTFISALHVMFTNTDVVYFCNAINSIFMIFPRIFGKKVIMNVNGLEWKRKKWNGLGKLAYRVSEWIATVLAHEIITDSKGIQSYYKEKFKCDSTYISYGANIIDYVSPGDVMKKYGLEKRKFLLYVSRLEPENNAHILVKAYEKIKGSMPLVIVGYAPYGQPYIKELKSTKDKRIIFTGGIFGKDCNELRCNTFLYIHGNEVGGTNPGLLEAMALGNCVIVNGVDFNKEVIGDAGYWFNYCDPDDLKNKIEYLIDNPEEAEQCREKAILRIKEYYNWDDVADKYETFFMDQIF